MTKEPKVIIKFNFWSSERQRCLHQFGRVVTKVNVVKVQSSKFKVMNKEMVLSCSRGGRFVAEMMSKVAESVNRPVNLLRTYYAQVLERDLNMHQTWALIEAQVAFFLGVMPVGYAFTLRAVALLWLVVAVKKCRRLLA